MDSDRTDHRSASPSGPFRFSENNFDLVRLVAAAEVAIRHSYVHLCSEHLPLWLEAPLALVPGVPVFFFLSGYLISRAWERSSGAKDYFRNRALRLFPALWACIALSVAILFLSGYLASVPWSPAALGMWVACQGSVFQFWNPEFLRDFGTGVVNGSLWSISVEIQFYVLTVLVYGLAARIAPRRLNLVLAALAIGFACFHVFQPAIAAKLSALPRGELLVKLYRVSFVPWFFMFLLGALAQRLSATLVPMLLARRVPLLCMYVACVFLDFYGWGHPLGNEVPAYLVPLMGAAVLCVSYSRPGLADRILRRNDVSYGLYIHHMPVVNLLRYLGPPSPALAVPLALGSATLLAVLSWRFIERPFLRRKRGAVRAIAAVPARGPDA